MHNFNFEISFVGLIISVIFRIMAAFMFAFVAYKAYREVGIKNGLIKLRKQLLASCSILFFINTVGMTLLIIRPLVSAYLFRLSTDALSLINSLGFFFIAYLFVKIYTQSYSTEGKLYHARMGIIEKDEALKVKKRKVVNK